MEGKLGDCGLVADVVEVLGVSRVRTRSPRIEPGLHDDVERID
jgi:hypothetical protein